MLGHAENEGVNTRFRPNAEIANSKKRTFNVVVRGSRLAGCPSDRRERLYRDVRRVFEGLVSNPCKN